MTDIKAKAHIQCYGEAKLTKNNTQGVLDFIDYYDREGGATATSKYAGTKKYACAFTDKPGQRIPKAGVSAEAGVGLARAEYSICEAEARGPNAGAGAHASVLGVGAMAKAEIASASASAGPLKVKAGIGVDTGVGIGVEGVEAKLLGTGFRLGPNPSVSILGSEVECSVM